MKCKYCKEGLDADDLYCSGCGKKVKKRHFAKQFFICAKCGKIKETGRSVCNNCYKSIQLDCKLLQSTIERVSGDIDRGYKRLEPYLKRYRIICDCYCKLYDYAELLPKEIEIYPPTFSEYLMNIGYEIDRLINERINPILNKLNTLGDITYLANLKSLRDELVNLQKEYVEFDEVLSPIRIDNIISTYEV